MTFTITYRTKDGSLGEVEMDAMNRTECMVECHKQGIVPVRVQEEHAHKRLRVKKNADLIRQGTQDAVHRPLANGRWHRMGISLVVLGVVGVVASLWLWFSTRPVQPNVTPPKMIPTDVKTTNSPSVQHPGENKVLLSTNKAVRLQSAVPRRVDALATNIVKVISVVTNADGSVIERYIRADGKKVRSIKPGPHLFKHASDDILAIIATTPDGQEMPPLPSGTITDEQFLRSLEDPIVVNDDDSEHDKLLKQSVIALRQEVEIMMKNGQSVREILAEHQKLHHENVMLRTQALLELKKIVEAGNHEEAVKYAKTVNAVLEKMGAAALPIPDEKQEVSANRRRHPNRGENK